MEHQVEAQRVGRRDEGLVLKKLFSVHLRLKERPLNTVFSLTLPSLEELELQTREKSLAISPTNVPSPVVSIAFPNILPPRSVNLSVIRLRSA